MLVDSDLLIKGNIAKCFNVVNREIYKKCMTDIKRKSENRVKIKICLTNVIVKDKEH